MSRELLISGQLYGKIAGLSRNKDVSDSIACRTAGLADGWPIVCDACQVVNKVKALVVSNQRALRVRVVWALKL